MLQFWFKKGLNNMIIIIVGVGNIGFYLSKSLLATTNHKIKIIEKNQLRCIQTADKLNTPIINGDGSNIQTLIKAKANHADILVALTGKDEDNFVCCQIAKNKFKIKTTIAKINNPKNLETIKTLAADIVVSNTNMLSNIITQQLNAIDYHYMTHFTMGDTAIVEFIVYENSKMKDKKICDINWPKNTLVIAITRNNKSIVPSGNSVLKAGDDVIISTKDCNKKYLNKLFN